MIPVEAIWLAVEPVDGRLGIDGLSRRIQQTLGRSPCDGSAYGFCNRAGNRIKRLVWDGTGVWLCCRRLHRGRFAWPRGDEPVWRMTPEAWRWLTAGVDWRRLEAKPRPDWQL